MAEWGTDPLRLRVRGGCMSPLLADGIWVEVYSQPYYWPGDVLVVLALDGRLLIHRLIAVYPHRTGWRWVTQADAAARADAAVPYVRILGRVEAPVSWHWRLQAAVRGGRCLLRRSRARLGA